MIVTVKAESKPDKYGLVRVWNADGTLNREFRITAKELADLQTSGNGLPPGVARDEWESGRAVVFGKAYEIGDACLVRHRDHLNDFDLHVKIGERKRPDGTTQDEMLKLRNYKGELVGLTLTADQLSKAECNCPKKITSVVNGTIVCEELDGRIV